MKTNFAQGLLCIVMMLCVASCITVGAGNYPLLFKAAESDDIALADQLIKNCEPINQTTIGMQTPLHVASASGQDKMVVWLLAHEADPLAQDQNGKTPYDFAMEQGQVNSATIISNYIETRKDEDDIYRLGKLKLLESLLYVKDYRRLYLLHYFAEAGDANNLAIQIQQTEDIDVATTAGKTSLHFAVIAGQVNSVTLLLDAGASSNIGDMYNKTPLYYAVEKNNVEIVKLLLNYGADPLIPSYCNNMNSLEFAKSINNQEMVALLQIKK